MKRILLAWGAILGLTCMLSAQETPTPVYPDGVTVASFGDNVVTDGTTFWPALEKAVEAGVPELWIREGATLAKSGTRYALKGSLTVHGNGAMIDGPGDKRFAVDVAATLPDKKLTLVVDNLGGTGAWGGAFAATSTVEMVFENCREMNGILARGTI